MASNINWINIDSEYPVAGQDNDSQGFRDNFLVIKNSFASTKIEIEDLQVNTAKLTTSNNFYGNDIINANLSSVTNSVFFGTDVVVQNIDVSFNNGHYQVFEVASNVNFNLTNWPQEGKNASMRLALYNVGDSSSVIVTFTSNDGNILYDSAFPVTFELDTDRLEKVVEFWTYDGGVNIFARYIGVFDVTPAGNSSGYILPKASATVLGGVKIGTGLSISNNGVLSANITSLDDFTTDDLSEGDNNLYLTLPNLTTLLSQISSTIPNDTKFDSTETIGSPIITSSATNILTVSSSDIEKFRVGQDVRIFGASTNDTEILAAPTIDSITKNGSFIGGFTFGYKIVQFEFNTGKYSPPSAEVTVTNINPTNINSNNNIAVNMTRLSTGYGILVYRKVLAGSYTTADYNLIAILGPKDLGNSSLCTYIDYFDFDLTTWSGKSLTRNEYTSTTGLIHFPLTVPTTGNKGWIDASIVSVSSASSRITLNNSFYFNNNVIISPNDTSLLQTAINTAIGYKHNSLMLDERIYYIDRLFLPNNFTFMGKSKNSILKKLPWSSMQSNTNSIFLISNNASASSLSFSNFTINGNMQNQYLINDLIDSYNNYIVYVKGTNISFDNVSVKNVIGGGIATPNPNNFTINLCHIEDSGLTDRYEFSPLLSDNGSQIFITNNIMKNFSSAIDASLTTTGIINANIVSNCGSGIIIYGASNLISSPNLILGPAGEYIPGPDIYNSEYDSVNIILEKDTSFLSDSYVYQENGNNFDLTANRAVITYKVNKLKKVDNVEELYDEVLINGNPPISGILNTNLTQGEFSFNISLPNVNTLLTTYSYSTLKSANANHVGLVYRVLLTEYVPAGDISGQQLIQTATPNQTFYKVTVTNSTNISIGSRVRLLGHGGTYNLNNLIGTITDFDSISKIYTIDYPTDDISVTGTGGQLTVEHTFVLAKGRIL